MAYCLLLIAYCLLRKVSLGETSALETLLRFRIGVPKAKDQRPTEQRAHCKRRTLQPVDGADSNSASVGGGPAGASRTYVVRPRGLRERRRTM